MVQRLEALLDEGQATLYAYRWYLITLGFCALAGYGFSAFNLTLAGDDWQNFIDGSTQYTWAVRIGRWGHRVVSEVTQDSMFAPSLTLTLFVVMLIVSGWIQATVMGLRERSTVFFFVALMLFHPIWSQEVNFKINHVSVGVALVLASIAAYVAHRAQVSLLLKRRVGLGLALIGLSALLVSLAMSIKQVYLFFTFGAVVFRVINDALHRDEFASPVRILQRVGMMVAVMVLGLLLYVVEVDISQRVYGVEPLPADHNYALTGSLVSSPADLSFTLTRFAETFGAYYFQDTLLMPLFIKVVFWLAVAALAIFSVRQGNPITAALLVLAMIGLLVMPWGIGILRLPANSYRFNALVPNSLIYAGMIALALHHLSARTGRWVLQVLAVGVLVVFLHQQCSIALVTYSINQRDYAIMNRVLVAVEQHPNYPLLLQNEDVRVVTVGTLDFTSQRPFDHPRYGNTLMDRSVSLATVTKHQPHKTQHLITLLQAEDIQYAPNALRYENVPQARRAAYTPIVETMSVFPQPGSVEITPDGDLIIMLGRPN